MRDPKDLMDPAIFFRPTALGGQRLPSQMHE